MGIVKPVDAKLANHGECTELGKMARDPNNIPVAHKGKVIHRRGKHKPSPARKVNAQWRC